MYYDLKEMEVLDGYKVRVRFEDQTSGVVDLTEMVNSGGVFTALKDRSVFRQAFIDADWAVLCWPGEIDIAPETLYDCLNSVKKS